MCYIVGVYITYPYYTLINQRNVLYILARRYPKTFCFIIAFVLKYQYGSKLLPTERYRYMPAYYEKN
jgi:hypothetical protein